jgi:muramoyltetrapeptide carboxypeptidase
MIIPPYLQPGDNIAIVATARKISEEEVLPAITFLKNLGLNVVTGKHLYKTEHQFAGSDSERSEDLQWAMDDDNIKAIVIARGGYGSVRLVEYLDFNRFVNHPKWIFGYSDVTVLHNLIHRQGIASLHATMPINFHKNEEATQSLVNCLFGKEIKLESTPNPLNRAGQANAQVVGGNLSLLYSLAGTPYDLDTAGKILFIEDLDEYLYHIDRMMMQLKLSGKLKHLAGLIVGGMTDMKDNTIPFGQTAQQIIYDAVKHYAYPVCFDFPAGHIDRNLALYFGKEATLSVSSQTVSLNY